MTQSPFDHLRQALAGSLHIAEEAGVRPDQDRLARCGIAEVVYGQGKTPEAIASACGRLIGRSGQVLITRCTAEVADQVARELKPHGLVAEYAFKTLLVRDPAAPRPSFAGTIGILTAGTSDWPIAAVAKLVAESAGCQVLAYQDCGVAGLHRLVDPLEALVKADVSAIIVAAGMDGVLPTVVAGLVDIPVIGLPTSTGYGHGGGGEGALTTMLQACAPGVAVVNIDNGVGAGAMAVLIAKRVNLARQNL